CIRDRCIRDSVNGLLGFITLGIYTPLEARVYCSQ
ncbi:Bor/Iss family lipoprotein, partial [Escherichia coli]